MREINLDVPNTAPVFALLYGGSGTGKTDFAGTLGDLGQVLVIDVDQGFKTLKFSPRLAKARSNLTVASFDTFKDLNDAYQHVIKNDPAMWTKLLKTDITCPFDWVVWDSWSELQWHMHLELRRLEDLAGTPNAIDFRKNLQIQHWGRLTDLNKLSVEKLRDCKVVNQLFTCLESIKEDEKSGTTSYGPSIHGKLVMEFPGYFDDVLYSYTDMAGKYHITTKPKGRWPAKTRLGIGQDVTDPYAKCFFSQAPIFSK